MNRSRRVVLGAALSAILLAGMLTTSFVVAQGASQDAASLQSLVQAALLARGYAEGVVGLGSSNGVSVSAESALLASGNSSLAAAQAQLNPGGNLSAGLDDVFAAMANFTAAAAGASASLQNAGLSSSVDLNADLAAVASLNASALHAASAIAQHERARPIGRQFRRLHILQTVAPVIEQVLALFTFQPLSLPDGIVGVLYGKRLQFGCAMTDASFVKMF